MRANLLKFNDLQEGHIFDQKPPICKLLSRFHGITTTLLSAIRPNLRESFAKRVALRSQRNPLMMEHFASFLHKGESTVFVLPGFQAKALLDPRYSS